jgi:alanine racemase
MNQIIKKIKLAIKPKYPTLNYIEINQERLKSNIQYLLNLKKGEIIPILKSNAYGHGINEIASILKTIKEINLIGVDSFPEYQKVYSNTNKEILILNEMPLETYKYCDFKRTHFIVYSQKVFNFLFELNSKAKIHLFVNTGMNREGIKNLATFLTNNQNIINNANIFGFCSHLSSAEDDDLKNNQQLNHFLKDLDILKRYTKPKYIHLGNSAGIFALNNSNLNSFRIGGAIYGYNKFSQKHPLYAQGQPLKLIMEVFSTVTFIQNLKKGETASYNSSYTASQDTRLALIPFGYYEGLFRNLSNNTQVFINKNQTYAPVAGNICMNLSLINIEKNDVNTGDIVKIISNEKGSGIDPISLAEKCHTIPYEIITRLSANIRRNII